MFFLRYYCVSRKGPFRWSFADLPCQAIFLQKFRVLWFGKFFLVAKYSGLRWIWSGIQELNFRYNPLAENVEFEGCVSCCVSRSKHKPWNFSIYWTPMRKTWGKLHWDQKGFARLELQLWVWYIASQVLSCVGNKQHQSYSNSLVYIYSSTIILMI